MQWELTGADRTTGDERTLLIEADNEASALRRGNRQGIMVAAVRLLDENDSVAGVFVPAVQSERSPSTPISLPPQQDTLANKLGSRRDRLFAIISAHRPAAGIAAVTMTVAVLTLGFIALRSGRGYYVQNFDGSSLSLDMARTMWSLSDSHKEDARRSSAEAIADLSKYKSLDQAEAAVLKKSLPDLSQSFRDISLFGGTGDGWLYYDSPIQLFNHAGGTLVCVGAIGSNSVYNTNKLDPKERAAHAFSELLLPNFPSLDKMTKLTDADYLAIGIVYGARDFSSEYASSEPESLTVIAPSKLVSNFVSGRITDQQMLDGSDVFLTDINSHSTPRKTQITLK
jgi:hypothetical protein